MSWRGKAAATGVAELKTILENIWRPEALDDHPWTRMRMVAETIQSGGSQRKGGAGSALLKSVSNVFEQMMPNVPPRRGIRLDTRWGEFGLLAARYFAPMKFGTPSPTTLRDAWGCIDHSILLYVFGQSDGSLPEDERIRYRLVGNEPDVAPMSTLSDWHKKGLQSLYERVQIRESEMQRRAPNESADPPSRHPSPMRSGRGRPTRFLAVLVLVLLVLLGVKAYGIYAPGVRVRQDVQSLEASLHSDSMSEAFLQSGILLQDLNTHLGQLEAELKPVLWLTPGLRWLPVYGDDLAHAGAFLDLAVHLSASATYAQSALAPLVPTYDGSPRPPIAELITLLSDAEPQLQLSLEELRLAQQARTRIDPDLLVPELRRLITQRVDPAMKLMEDALPLAAAAPSLLGAGEAGPRTYLLMAQNEDELRPTGGFITAVGKVVLDRGRVSSLAFENSGALDNWSMPYPLAPWQLSRYMNSRVLILRDANWFPDFPTATLYVRQLYAYVHQDSVDGIVAFDQHALVMVLRTLGPIRVDSVDYPITAENVIDFMRTSKAPAGGGYITSDFDQKAFIRELAEPILERILRADTDELRPLAVMLMQALDEGHVILQLDDQDIRAVVRRRGWNGGLQSDTGDFLALVDSNVGFNKVNAVVDTAIAYAVDVSDLSDPKSQLMVSHVNRTPEEVACLHWDASRDEREYPIYGCYWDYMRVYAPFGAQLISATPQTIPEAWMILSRSVPPTVDVLDEPWPGLEGFGTLIVVPAGGKIDTEMRFALPASRVLTRNSDGSYTYTLTVRKQPGTLAIPLTVRIHLPNGATIESPAPGWVVQGNNILIETDLRVDRNLQVQFRLR